jgi:hypothetical protein
MIKKRPTVQEVRAAGQGSVFRRFEEGSRWLTSHSESSMVVMLPGYSRKINVWIRKIRHINPQKQLHKSTAPTLYPEGRLI